MLIIVLWSFVFIPFAGTIFNTTYRLGNPGPSVKPSFFPGHNRGTLCRLYSRTGPNGSVLPDESSDQQEAEFKGLWVGFRKHYWQAAGVYAIYTGVLLFACLIWSSVFVLEQFTLKILGFLFYLFLFLLVASLYLPGFIVFQRNTLKKVIKKTLILFMDNTLVTIGAFLTLLLVGVAFAFLAPLLLFFYGSFLQVLLIRLFHGVMAKYPDPVAPALGE